MPEYIQRVWSITAILFNVWIPNSECGCNLWLQSVAYHYSITVNVALTSGHSSKIIVPWVYLLYAWNVGVNIDFHVWPYFGDVDCSVLFCEFDYSKRVQSSFTTYDIEIPNLIWEYRLGSWNVACCLRVQWALTSSLSCWKLYQQHISYI